MTQMIRLVDANGNEMLINAEAITGVCKAPLPEQIGLTKVYVRDTHLVTYFVVKDTVATIAKKLGVKDDA